MSKGSPSPQISFSLFDIHCWQLHFSSYKLNRGLSTHYTYCSTLSRFPHSVWTLSHKCKYLSFLSQTSVIQLISSLTSWLILDTFSHVWLSQCCLTPNFGKYKKIMDRAYPADKTLLQQVSTLLQIGSNELSGRYIIVTYRKHAFPLVNSLPWKVLIQIVWYYKKNIRNSKQRIVTLSLSPTSISLFSQECLLITISYYRITICGKGSSMTQWTLVRVRLSELFHVLGLKLTSMFKRNLIATAHTLIANYYIS